MRNRACRKPENEALTTDHRWLRAALRPAAVFLSLSSLIFPASMAEHAAAAGAAQQSSTQIVDLIDRIESLPIEYRADLTFTLLKQVPQRVSLADRGRLLHSIFADAYSAKYPWPMIYANSPGGTVDARKASDLVWLPLDTISIQSAALALSPDQPDALWEVFESLPSPRKRTDCSESLTPDARSYYKTMVQLLTRNLSGGPYPNQTSAEQYLIDAVRRVEAPSQLLGWLDAVNTFNLDPSRQNDVVLALASRLASVTAADREMSGIEGTGDNLSQAIQLFLIRQKLYQQSAATLLQAYRAFLINGLHQQQCEDFTLDRAAEADRFNALDPALIGESPKPVLPLSEADLVATGRAGSANVEMIESGSRVRDQLHRLFETFQANQDKRYDAVGIFAPSQPQGSDVRDILATVNDASQAADQSELSSYENRQVLLLTALTLLRSGPSFQDVVDAEVAFLTLNPVEQSSPPEWLRALKDLLLMSRPIPQVPGQVSIGSDKDSESKVNLALDTDFIRSTLRRHQDDRIIAAYMAYEDTIRPVYQF